MQNYGNIHCSDVHLSGENFICSGENILHDHPTEIAVLPKQTSK